MLIENGGSVIILNMDKKNSHISLGFNLLYSKQSILIRIKMLKVRYTLNDSIGT